MNKLLMTLCACLLALLVACGATVDWESRVGSWTYENAAQEYGQERNSQELPDGGTVYYWYGKWRDRLVLEFGPDGKLRKVEDHYN